MLHLLYSFPIFISNFFFCHCLFDMDSGLIFLRHVFFLSRLYEEFPVGQQNICALFFHLGNSVEPCGKVVLFWGWKPLRRPTKTAWHGFRSHTIKKGVFLVAKMKTFWARKMKCLVKNLVTSAKLSHSSRVLRCLVAAKQRNFTFVCSNDINLSQPRWRAKNAFFFISQFTYFFLNACKFFFCIFLEWLQVLS